MAPHFCSIQWTERTVQLFCEAQITADAKGIIVNIEAIRDTDGEGFSRSRCADLSHVKDR